MTPRQHAIAMIATVLSLIALLGACSDGLRTTLVVPGSTEEALPPLELDLPPAPESVLPVAPDGDDAQLQR